MAQEFSQMMAIGPYYFALSTAAYQSLNRDLSWRYATIDRQGREPATQYLGPGQQKVTVSGVIYPQFKGGLTQIADMRAAADLGAGLLMVDGQGNVMGEWCIQGISENNTVFTAKGAPRRIDFTMTLISYGGDTP